MNPPENPRAELTLGTADNAPPSSVNLLESIGDRSLRFANRLGDALYLLVDALSGLKDLAGPTGFYLRRTILQQVYFTAAQAFWLVNLIGILLGILVVLPLETFGVTDVETQAHVMQLALFHQLAPLLAALVVIGRSGTAVTAELGDLNQRGALQSLLAMGVEPHRFVVLPRVIGMTVSLLLLGLWGNLAAVAGAGAYNALRGISSFGNFAAACVARVSPLDVVFTSTMILSFGVFIALIHCHFGLRSTSTVEVQRNLPRAFVISLLGLLVLTVLFVAVRS
jgi:phospholipid/cholesterol/gamma-HCH transport system permease protein